MDNLCSSEGCKQNALGPDFPVYSGDNATGHIYDLSKCGACNVRDISLTISDVPSDVTNNDEVGGQTLASSAEDSTSTTCDTPNMISDNDDNNSDNNNDNITPIIQTTEASNSSTDKANDDINDDINDSSIEKASIETTCCCGKGNEFLFQYKYFFFFQNNFF